MLLTASLQRGGQTPFQASQTPPLRPRRCSVVTHTGRRDTLLAGLVATGSLLLPLDDASAAAAAPAARKPFCAVVDQVPAWAYNTPWREDLVSYAGGKTWYRFVNYLPPPSGFINKLTRNLASNIAQDKAPLLVLAGGPGLPVSYLEPLELMAGVGRQVIFYDQVGCGNTFLASNSTCPPADQLTLDLYLRQIDALREALGLEKVHLYGQGIGGMLALSYAASKQGAAGGVLSVTAASTASSYSQLVTDRRAALKGLGEAAEAALLAADDAGSSSSKEAAGALHQYTQQYVCRSPAATAASPAGCARLAAQQRSRPVFDALAGGRYFSPAGVLAGWDAQGLGLSSLQETPVLVTRGEFDEVSHASAQQLAGLLPNCQMAEFAGAGSYQHIDAWEPHLTRIELHLCAAEGSPIPKTA